MLAHKIKLKPNNKQKTYFAKACGVARFAYNWALAEWQNEYQAGKKPNDASLRRKLNAIKHEQFPWMLEVTKNAPQMEIIQLGKAFKNFFAKRAQYPVFRKKGIRDRFTLTNDQFSINHSRIRTPNLGWVRMRESLRLEGKILSATISKKADCWFVSITVDTTKINSPVSNKNQAAIGVDLGITHLAKLSSGKIVENPRSYKNKIIKLKRLSKNVSRKQKGSKSRKKAVIRLGRLHMKICNLRSDAIHKLTSSLIENYSVIGIEDLNVKGMLKNVKLSQSIADAAFYEIRRQLEYKAHLNNKKIVIADRWYPSSKLCSVCGYKNQELSLSDRTWTCIACNTQHDRDFNAAKNLEKMAVSYTVAACGASSSGSNTSSIR